MKPTMIFARLSFFAMTLGLIWVAGVFFLTPYYIIGGYQELYEKPVPIHLETNEYLMTIKCSTSIHSVGEPVSIHAGLQLNSTTCTDVFPYPVPGGYCEQLVDSKIQFVDFSPMQYESSSGYIGPRERAEHVALINMKVPIASDLRVFIDLYEFQKNKTNCTSDSDCKWFSTLATLPTDGPAVCFSPSVALQFNLKYEGCAKHLTIGNYSQCGTENPDPFHLDAKLSSPSCRFTVYWSIYLKPPDILLIGGMWVWGSLAWASAMSIWMFIALYFGRKMHLSYTDMYYFDSLHYSLKEGCKYALKIYVTGEQFSTVKGTFNIGQAYSLPMTVELGTENVEGTGEDTQLIRGQFTCQRDEECTCTMTWDGQFEIARFQQPSVHVVLRRKLPFLLKTRMNAVFLPYFYIYHAIFMRFRGFVSPQSYHVLFLYHLALHISFFASVGFWAAFWNSSHAVGSIVCYVIYSLSILVVCFMWRTHGSTMGDMDEHAVSLFVARQHPVHQWHDYTAMTDYR